MAGPGSISSDPRSDVSALSRPPNVSSRGGWIGGGAALHNPSVVIHEVGHTLHWPHSYIGPSDEYDNPVDVMSGDPVDFFDSTGDLTRFCPGLDPDSYIWCRAQNTLAFNRFAAGWINGEQVAIHRSGRVNYTLGKPSGTGLQMVALPDRTASLRMLTLEARPAVGYDEDLVKAGVAVHVIDQGASTFDSISTQRHQRQAVGRPNSYEHVLAPGEKLTVDGATITVLGIVGDGYQVNVNGTYANSSALLTQSTEPSASCASHFLASTSLDRGACWK